MTAEEEQVQPQAPGFRRGALCVVYGLLIGTIVGFVGGVISSGAGIWLMRNIIDSQWIVLVPAVLVGGYAWRILRHTVYVSGRRAYDLRAEKNLRSRRTGRAPVPIVSALAMGYLVGLLVMAAVIFGLFGNRTPTF